MDEHEQALEDALADLNCLIEMHHSPTPDYTRTYRRAIHHAANAIREILTKYQDMK